MTTLVERTERFVRDALADIDGSHDWWHIHRVRLTARALAREEVADEELVELASLLHDVGDWKYSGVVGAGADAARAFLVGEDYDEGKIDTICGIIANMGFKDSLDTDEVTARERARYASSVEFKCVQDADRLDAIGAIGIGRTFCFGGAKKNPMHVPGVEPLVNMTMKEYMASHDSPRPNTTVNHFAEKLLKLKDLMNTNSARKRAEKRHETMVWFLERFMREWDGEE